MRHGKYEKKKQPKIRAAASGKRASGRMSNTNRVLLKVMIVLLSVLLVLMLAAVFVMNYVLGRITRLDSEDTSLQNNEQIVEEFETYPTEEGETYETVDPNSVKWDEVEIITDEDIINILLVGQDARPGETRARSDTMILVSLNEKTNAIQMTSFMRDMYVQIPGYSDNRINASFAFGGAELLNSTLKTNFGIQVDGTVSVNFEAFEKIIDILGGVDIEVDAEEARYMRGEGVDSSEGMNHFDGAAALTFARMRYVSGGDYSRTERQRRLITSVIDSLKGAGLTEIISLINDVLPYVGTDLSNSEIVSYATKGLAALGNGGEMSSLRIPADDAHYAAKINGMDVLVPDLEMCQEDLRDFIYSAD